MKLFQKIIAFAIAFVFGYVFFGGMNNPFSERSKADIIDSIVTEVQTDLEFPYTTSEHIVWTSIEGSATAVQYRYQITGGDESFYETEELNDYLADELCVNTMTRSILDDQINLEYFYTSLVTDKEYYGLVTRNDCVEAPSSQF